jgi:hypothetical protein
MKYMGSMQLTEKETKLSENKGIKQQRRRSRKG